MEDETKPAPLSDAEIAAIANHYCGYYDEPSAEQWSEIRQRLYGKMTFLEYYDDAPLVVVRLHATLAERDARLAALSRENAAMREIVAAVADGLIANDAAPHWRYCLYCSWHADDYDTEPAHDEDCPVTRARALLATPQTPATGATAGEEGEEGEEGEA